MTFKNGLQLKYILIIALFISGFCSTAQAWEDEDLKHWAQGKSAKLYWGDTLDTSVYRIEAYDFPRTDRKGQINTPYVGVNLYKDGELVASESLLNWDSFIYEGEVRVTVVDIMAASDIHWQNDAYEPWAEIRMELRALPDLDISIVTDKGNDDDTYKVTDSKIIVTLTVQNKGDAPITEVDLNVDFGGLEFETFSPEKKTYFTEDEIHHGASITKIFYLKTPSHMNDTDYEITVNVTGIDEKEVVHNFTKNKDLTVLNMITIIKNAKSDIFMTDTAFVQVTIRNDGAYAVNGIELKDTVGDYFELIGSSSLLWNFNLGSKEYKDYKYTIKPVKPNKNGYTLPEAEASWVVNGIEYNQTSDEPKIIVHGSKILLEKTVSPTQAEPNANVTVTVTATNVGDVKASVEIFDQDPLPENVTLVSGELYTKEVIDEEDSISMSYIVMADTDGHYELPRATAKFFDLQGYRSEEVSDSPVFTAGNPAPVGQNPRPGYTATPTPIPVPVATREEPGFGILTAIMGVCLAVYMTLRRQ
ncbi:MAG: BatD family protein [ANME-2 cluster archaeon]|nr:BatD family protein [ANME-2 cluster archaeon]